jgi:hypothetical protein
MHLLFISARSCVGGVSFEAMTRVAFKMGSDGIPSLPRECMLLSLLRDRRQKLHRLPGVGRVGGRLLLIGKQTVGSIGDQETYGIGWEKASILPSK